MKKLLLFLVVVFAMFSCEKDSLNESELQLPGSISIHVGDLYNLSSSDNLICSNKFVAEANSGTIKGMHVGQCTVSCGNKQCKVTVAANHTLYLEPLCYSGLTKDKVISLYGQPDRVSSDGTVIGYETGLSYAPIITYLFENGSFKCSSVQVEKSYLDELKIHLQERYYYLQYSDGWYTYIDAYESAKMTKFVMYKSYNSSYYAVMYQPS